MKYEENIKEENDKKVDIKIGDLVRWTDGENSTKGVCFVAYDVLVSLKDPDCVWKKGTYSSSIGYVQHYINVGDLVKLNPGDSVTLTQE